MRYDNLQTFACRRIAKSCDAGDDLRQLIRRLVVQLDIVLSRELETADRIEVAIQLITDHIYLPSH